ncbi:DUF3617 domain-containing protein [Aurantiacibacter poecillastricola]|uniref:DUF3617 domain-containing protein n=1 Tax=Aurantiacibacter poecillastricola TaxID=3064385 RepID=UPI00273E9308|nr:DUF3617 domain-containing protein [Aurantiacibacter sp. 219JJ12-13]MDP5261442.1 DUF3617 domain-containing protein [Aurantiacibacter sp. 219JJ12-13]
MNFKFALCASAVFALAACGDSGTVEDPNDPAQIEAATRDLPKPQPGEYRTTGELVELELPGASEEEVQMMRGIMEQGAAQDRTFCMTQEEADQGYQEFLDNMAQGSDECEFTEFTVSGDNLDATMACDDGAGSVGTMSFGGTISETSQDMTVTMDMENAGEGQAMRMVLRNRSERIGECEG